MNLLSNVDCNVALFPRPSVIHILSSSVPISDYITTLGVILDSNLTLNKHVSSVCKSAYYSAKALRHIRPVLTCDMARAVAASLTQTRLDFANSVLIGTSGSNINKLQRVQNCLAREYSKTIITPLPPSYQNSTGFQSISELISKLLHLRTSHLHSVRPLIVFGINTSASKVSQLS